jgi:hypothetical protein
MSFDLNFELINMNNNGRSKNCFFFVGLQFLKLPAVRASPFSFTTVNSGFKKLVRLEKSNF